ncbi:MAG: peptidase C45 [Planctomycetales bacterium]|nr:peptidase C45 [Planctomycetales bacterium]
MNARYRVVDVAGTPRQMGHQIGEAAGDEIRGFCASAMEHIHRSVRISRERAVQVARDSADYVDHYAPHMLDELRGMSEAARVSLDDLMLLQVRNQLQPDEDAGCTALSLDRPLRAGRLVAQNWDADPALDAFTIVLIRRPSDLPAYMSLTQAGLIAYMGFNSAGIGACVNTLPAPVRGVGVPHYFTLRGIFESTSLDEAYQRVASATRAIPANIVLTTPQGPADLEVSIDDVRLLRDDGQGRLTHTNHCHHPEITKYNEQFPELIQSHARQRRIDQLLTAAGDQVTAEDVQAMLRDHQDHPHSICRHMNDDPRFGFWQTVFSIIIEPEQRRMQVTRGTPCDHPFEVYELT